MKTMRWFSIFLVVLVVGWVTNVFAESTHEFDVKSFQKIAKKTIGRVISGNIDADKMLADMEKLVEIGVAGCKEHMGKPETPPDEVKLMKITIENAAKMKSLTLAEIEPQWHEGGFAKSNGIDISKYKHFDKVMCYYDGVVHPATAVICLKEYKKTKDEDLLDQIKDELAEVVEHMKHLE